MQADRLDYTNLRPHKPQYAKGYKPSARELQFGGESLSDSRVPQALNKHVTALDVLKWKGRSIPSISSMEKELKAPASPGSVLAHIPALEESHIEDLERLYDKHAIEGLKETIDLYRSTDETQRTGTQVQCDKMDQIVFSIQNTDPLLLPLAEEYSVLRHAHLKKLQQLERHAARLKQAEESKFPETPEQLWAKPHEFQMKVARILVADNPFSKDKYLSEYGWSSLNLKPLAEEYKRNITFSTRLSAMLLQEQFK